MPRPNSDLFDVKVTSYGAKANGSLEQIFSAMEAILSSAAPKSSKAAVRSVKRTFQDAFERVGEGWARDIAQRVDKEAALRDVNFMADNLYRHLYTAGNPSNAGDPSHRLFRFIPKADERGIDMQLRVDPDTAPSWSPVTQRTSKVSKGGGYGQPNEPWPERALFVFAKQLDLQDYDQTFGDRSGTDLPRYLAKPKPDGGYIVRDSFKINWSAQKSHRDKMMREETAVTANQIVSMLDKEMEKSIAFVLKQAQAEAGKRTAMMERQAQVGAGMVGRGRTKKGLKSMARDGANTALVEKYGRIFNKVFAEQGW